MKQLLTLLLLSALAFGQGSILTGPPVATNSSGSPAPKATVTVCNSNPGTGTCNSLATTYTSIALGTACSGASQPLNNQANPSVGSGCSNPGFTDGLGNVAVFVNPGTYYCQYSGSGLTTVSYPCIGPASGTGVAGSPRAAIQVATQNGNFTSSNSPIYASQQAGGDLASRIVNADLQLGANPGEIWVDQAAGTTATSVMITLNAGHVLRFIQGGTYTFQASGTCGSIANSAICMLGNTLLAGGASAMAVNTTPAVTLQMANGANLSSIVTVNGPYAAIEDLVIDGNKANNAGGGSGIVGTSLATRLEVDRVTSGNFHTNGVTLNGGASDKFFKLMAYQNSNDGLSCIGSASGGGDGFVSNSEFEANAGNGVELNGCPGWRIIQNDFGQNSQTINNDCGLNIYGSGSVTSNFEMISGNQFGAEFRNALCIIGYGGGGVTAVGTTITGNSFIGSGNYLLANTYAELLLQDGGLHTVTGNVFSASGGAVNSNYAGISITETSSGRSFGNRITGNTFVDTSSNGGSPAFGTGRVVDSTVTNGLTCSSIAANDFAISSGWGTAAAISANSGYVPNCAFIITTGSAAFGASPTVTITYPGSMMAGFNQTPACTLSLLGVTGSGGAINMNPTTISITSTIFTAQLASGAAFTPAASETYKLALSCNI